MSAKARKQDDRKFWTMHEISYLFERAHYEDERAEVIRAIEQEAIEGRRYAEGLWHFVGALKSLGIADAVAAEPAKQQPNDDGKDPDAVSLGRRGGKKGGKKRAENMTPGERSEAASLAARARWSPPSTQQNNPSSRGEV